MPFFDHFGFIARWYDRTSPFTNRQKMVDVCNLPADGYLLDLGGGTGRVAFGLKDLSKHAIVADVSLGMLRQAQPKKGIITVCAESEKLPFAEKVFDRIIMIDAFHHVAVQQTTLTEMWRTLSSGGRLVIQEPDIRDPFIKVLAFIEKILLMRSHFLDAEKIVAGIQKIAEYTHQKVDVEVKSVDRTIWIIVDKTG